MSTPRLAVIGAGVIGRMHIDLLAGGAVGSLAAVVDPSPAATALAAGRGVPWFADHPDMLESVRPDGVVIATPNALHTPVALDCLARGVPVLIEKPIADTVAAAQQVVEASRRTGVPVLVGHHRRHNPVIRRAREAIAAGLLGRLVSVSVLATMLKPDSYFDIGWRREKGGGPVLINLIHEIDLLRFLCGEIDGIQAMSSNAVRGFAVEDTAAVLLRFRSGALASIALSDAAASPWSWDLVSGELAAMARQHRDTHFLCGTEGSLSLPTLEHWRYAGARGWHAPLSAARLDCAPADPYARQLLHFGRVIRGEEAPLVSAEDATRTLAATLAVQVAAARGDERDSIAPGPS
ncbi:MAG: Gfo/Idh/MocA family oxidoreductase [Rhodospirillales bacterium]|nr:Gfo/Idh/MocA family oxidoreductase [Rhodospirillales bacterium]